MLVLVLLIFILDTTQHITTINNSIITNINDCLWITFSKVIQNINIFFCYNKIYLIKYLRVSIIQTQSLIPTYFLISSIYPTTKFLLSGLNFIQTESIVSNSVNSFSLKYAFPVFTCHIIFSLSTLQMTHNGEDVNLP